MSTLKAITFLGTTPYKDTTYYMDSNESPATCYFGVTLKHFFPDIKEIYVVMTKEAREKHWDSNDQNNIQHQLNDLDIKVSPVDIESGKNENELWDIFECIIKLVDEEDTIIFDITNGFRSIPLIALLIANFIRVVKNAHVVNLVYGAFDAKDNETNRTPVFDLTPFLQLLDWTTATSTFLQTGRAERLTELAQRLDGASVKDFASQLQTLSQELLTTRPLGVIQSVSTLPALLEQVKQDQNPQIKPLGLLLDKIEQKYTKFVLPAGGAIASLDAAYTQARVEHRAFLSVQLDMIDWYIGKGLPIQALTLAREWLVSLGVYYQQGIDLFNYKERGIVERILNNNRRKNDKPDPPVSKAMKKHLDEIRELWPAIEPKNESVKNDETISGDDSQENIREVRNDIAHCGMDKRNARSAAVIQAEMKQISQKLRALLPEAGQ